MRAGAVAVRGTAAAGLPLGQVSPQVSSRAAPCPWGFPGGNSSPQVLNSPLGITETFRCPLAMGFFMIPTPCLAIFTSLGDQIPG